MSTFVAIYRGQTVNTARLIGITAEPELVNHVAKYLMRELQDDDAAGDSAIRAVQQARAFALKRAAEVSGRSE